MLLTRERQICEGQLLPFTDRDELFSLAWRHDLVIEALEQDHRAVEVVGEVDGGSFAVQIRPLRVRTDQSVEVTRFELVRVLDERNQIADSEVAGAGIEKIAFGERDQRGESTRRATGDGNAFAVGKTALDKISGGIDTIVDVDHAPIAVEAHAVRAPVTG